MCEAKITQDATMSESAICRYIAEKISEFFALDVHMRPHNDEVEFTVLSPNGRQLGSTTFFPGTPGFRRSFGGRTGIFLEGCAGAGLTRTIQTRLDIDFPVDG